MPTYVAPQGNCLCPLFISFGFFFPSLGIGSLIIVLYFIFFLFLLGGTPDSIAFLQKAVRQKEKVFVIYKNNFFKSQHLRNVAHWRTSHSAPYHNQIHNAAKTPTTVHQCRDPNTIPALREIEPQAPQSLRVTNGLFGRFRSS